MRLVQCRTQQGAVALAAAIIGNNTHKAHPLLCCTQAKTRHQRGYRCRHAPRIDHQHHGQSKHTGTIGCAARGAAVCPAVKQAHHAFTQSYVGSRRMGTPNLPHACLAHHPCVKAIGWALGGIGMKAGVNIIWSALKSLHMPAPSGQKVHQGYGKRCFAFT